MNVSDNDGDGAKEVASLFCRFSSSFGDDVEATRERAQWNGLLAQQSTRGQNGI